MILNKSVDTNKLLYKLNALAVKKCDDVNNCKTNIDSIHRIISIAMNKNVPKSIKSCKKLTDKNVKQIFKYYKDVINCPRLTLQKKCDKIYKALIVFS